MIEWRYQTAWPRIKAAFVDGLVFLPLSWADIWFFDQGFSPWANLVVFTLITTMSFHIYSVVMHGLYGQTLGKMVVGVVVQAIDGDELGVKRAFKRDVVIIVFALVGLVLEAPDILKGVNPYESVLGNPAFDIFIYGSLIWLVLEVLTMFTNNRRRAIHDLIAGSVVVREDAMKWTPIIGPPAGKV